MSLYFNLEFSLVKKSRHQHAHDASQDPLAPWPVLMAEQGDDFADFTRHERKGGRQKQRVEVGPCDLGPFG